MRTSYPVRLFMANRGALIVLAFFSLCFLPVLGSEGYWRAFADNYLLDGWARWDSGWYRDIAREGYTAERAAFFPLYPLSTAIVAFVVREVHVAGILVSLGSFCAALVALWELGRARIGERATRLGLLLLVCFPFSFYFSAVYSESLFLAVSAWTFVMLQRGRFGAAAGFAALASATRPTGALAAVAVAVATLEREGLRAWPRALARGAIGGLGLVAYSLFLWLKFGNPLLFVDAQQAWSYHGGVGPLLELGQAALSPSRLLRGEFPAMHLLHLIAGVGSVALLVRHRRKLGLPQTLWAVGIIAMSIPRWPSMGRFVSAVFPVFFAAGLEFERRDESGFEATRQVFLMLLALLTVMFTHWYWVI